MREKQRLKSQRRYQLLVRKKEADKLANGMLIRNAALEQQGFMVNEEELVIPVQPCSANAEGVMDAEENLCASVDTPSSSYPSRSPSPERTNLEVHRLHSTKDEDIKQWEASRQLQEQIEENRAQRMREYLQWLKAANVARARRARAIFDCNMNK